MNVYDKYKKYKHLYKNLIAGSDIHASLKHLGFSESKIRESLKRHGNDLLLNLLELLPIVIINNKKQLLPQLKQYGISKMKQIGEGSYGKVYVSKIKGSPLEWTLKTNKDREDLQDRKELLKIVREMAYYFVFSQKQIGPQIPNHFPFFINPIKGSYTILTQHYTSDLDGLLKHLMNLDSDIQEHMTETICEKIDNCLNIMLLELGVFCIDMKPQNILVEWNAKRNMVFDVVLTDFGVDFCCNSNVEPLCSFIEKHPSLLDNNRLSKTTFVYLKSIILFSLVVTSYFLTGILLFQKEMIHLKQMCHYHAFQDVLEQLCGGRYGDCKNLEPPFYYLDFYARRDKAFREYITLKTTIEPYWKDLKQYNPHLYWIEMSLEYILE